MNHWKRAERKKEKRIDAEKRKEARAKRSDDEQIRMLDLKYGPGKGAMKERNRLQKRIASRNKS